MNACVVVGAGGGVGTTLVAAGIALAWARRHTRALIVELDFDLGDLAGMWSVPCDRTVDDLLPVAGELTQAHLGAALSSHDQGVDVLPAPGRPGAAQRWTGAAARSVVALATQAARVAVDGGPGLAPHVRAVAVEAGAGLLVVTPPTLAGGRRALRIAEALAEHAPETSVRLVVNLGARDAEIGASALGTATGLPVVSVLPRCEREAADLACGRWPRGRRTPLARELVDLAGVLG